MIFTEYVSQILDAEFIEKQKISDPTIREITYGYQPELGYGNFGNKFNNKYYLAQEITKEEAEKLSKEKEI